VPFIGQPKLGAVAVLEALGVTPDLPILYPGVNDGTWSASMSGRIDGDGGHLMHRSGICPNGQPYALAEDCREQIRPRSPGRLQTRRRGASPRLFPSKVRVISTAIRLSPGKVGLNSSVT
jgi:hypothetical protein